MRFRLKIMFKFRMKFRFRIRNVISAALYIGVCVCVLGGDLITCAALLRKFNVLGTVMVLGSELKIDNFRVGGKEG